jgi:hypothetical protein
MPGSKPGPHYGRPGRVRVWGDARRVRSGRPGPEPRFALERFAPLLWLRVRLKATCMGAWAADRQCGVGRLPARSPFLNVTATAKGRRQPRLPLGGAAHTS